MSVVVSPIILVVCAILSMVSSTQHLQNPPDSGTQKQKTKTHAKQHQQHIAPPPMSAPERDQYGDNKFLKSGEQNLKPKDDTKGNAGAAYLGYTKNNLEEFAGINGPDTVTKTQTKTPTQAKQHQQHIASPPTSGPKRGQYGDNKFWNFRRYTQFRKDLKSKEQNLKTKDDIKRNEDAAYLGYTKHNLEEFAGINGPDTVYNTRGKLFLLLLRLLEKEQSAT